MKICEVTDVIKFPGKQHRVRDEITGLWNEVPDNTQVEYMVTCEENGRTVGIAVYHDERKANIRAKKEILLGKQNVEVIEL